MNKKICIICPQYFPVPAVEGGAIETLIDEYLRHNSKTKKNYITVYSPASSKLDFEYNKKYINTEFRYISKKTISNKLYKLYLAAKRRILRSKQIPSSYAIAVIKDLKKRKELSKYDLVIVENQVGSLIQYGSKIKSPVVEHLHNDYLNVSTKEGYKITKSCSEFWGVSKFICSQINKINKNCNTKVLYNGIDINKYNSRVSSKEKKSYYNKMKLKKEDFIILYVGRIYPDKGVLELAQSFNKIKKENDNMKLLIVGKKRNDSQENNLYYDKLLVEKRKNNDSILLYGNATTEELKVLYNISNLQVVPTLCEEAFGLVVIEGMSAKLPLIITNSGGMTEIANENVTIVKKNNILEELPTAILEKQNKKNEVDYKNTLSRFTIENYCINFDKLISNFNK